MLSNQLPTVQDFLDLQQTLILCLLGLVIGSVSKSVQFLNSRLQICLILEDQLVDNNAQISDWINFSFNMCHISVIEASTNMEESITSADVREEGIAQTLTFRSSFDQTSNVSDIKECRDSAGWLEMFHQPVEALIGDIHSCLVGVDGAEREVLSLGFTLGEDVEERTLSDVRETKNTNLKTIIRVGKDHFIVTFKLVPRRPKSGGFSSTTCFLGGILLTL